MYCEFAALREHRLQPEVVDSHAFFVGPTKLTVWQLGGSGVDTFEFDPLPGLLVHYLRKPSALEWLAAFVG
jgi:hypothetical protein